MENQSQEYDPNHSYEKPAILSSSLRHTIQNGFPQNAIESGHLGYLPWNAASNPNPPACSNVDVTCHFNDTCEPHPDICDICTPQNEHQPCCDPHPVCQPNDVHICDPCEVRPVPPCTACGTQVAQITCGECADCEHPRDQPDCGEGEEPDTPEVQEEG